MRRPTRHLPRNPADRTPEDWLMIDMGGYIIRWVAIVFTVGAIVGFVIGLAIS